MAVAEKKHINIEAPASFHALLMAEAKRQGISMKALLHFYGEAMIEAIKAQG